MDYLVPVVFIVIVGVLSLCLLLRHVTEIKAKAYRNAMLGKVKSGERIRVNISGFVVTAKCLRNSPETKKMFLRLYYTDGKHSDGVKEYNDYTFVNFEVLNSDKASPPPASDSDEPSARSHG